MQKGPAIFIILIAVVALGFFTVKMYQKYNPPRVMAPGGAQQGPSGMHPPTATPAP